MDINPTLENVKKKASKLIWELLIVLIVYAIKDHYRDLAELIYGNIIPDDEDVVLKTDNYLMILSIIQVIVLLIIVFSGRIFFRAYIQNKSKSKNKNKEEIIENLKGILNGITLIIITWILLYLWLFIFLNQYIDIPEAFRKKSFVWSVADFFHALTGLFSIYCFISMEHMKISDENRLMSFKRMFLPIVITAATFYLSYLGRHHENALQHLGPILLSLWVALCMQYFFGKLDSLHLQIKRLYLAPIYIYVLFQILWPTFADSEVKEALFIMILGFLLKIYLFGMLIHWITGTNKFWRYLNMIIKSQKSKDF